MRIVSALCLMLALTTFACDDSDGGGGESTVPVTQVYETLAATYCQIFTSCPAIGDDIIGFSTFAKEVSATDCKAFVLRILTPEIDLEAEVTAGRMTFDATKFKSCTSSARQSCDIESLEACRDVFEGQIALDGPCEFSEQCAGDAYCETGFDSCGGTCKPRSAIGGECDTSDACSFATGTTACSYVDEGTPTCQPLERISNAAENAACGRIYLADKVQEIACGAGLVCEYGEDGDAQTCVKTLAPGASCADTAQDCPSGQLCLPGASGPTCQELPLVGEGATCNGDPESGPLAVCNPFEQIGCDAGKCKAWGDGSVGSFCGNDIGFDLSGLCGDANFCDGETNLCVTKKPNEQPCEQDSECASGNCDFGTETCAEAEVCE